MTYELMIRARAQEAIPIDEVHRRVFDALLSLPDPWSLTAPVPAVPKVEGLSAGVALRGKLGKGIRGHVMYPLRRMLRDAASSDDTIDLLFSPKRVNISEAAELVLPTLIEAIGAYKAQFGDEDLVLRKTGAPLGDQRCIVARLYPICFYDAELCRRAFGIEPDEVCRRLEGLAERVTCRFGGVYIVGSTEQLDIDAADALGTRMMEAVRG